MKSTKYNLVGKINFQSPVDDMYVLVIYVFDLLIRKKQKRKNDCFPSFTKWFLGDRPNGFRPTRKRNQNYNNYHNAWLSVCFPFLLLSPLFNFMNYR